ncbi:zinc finger domain-containing protein [Streptomyces aurantiogriseus]|uniref:DNA-binding phage zinc finger domain-containing protein n=1 Tax=Streptomyces aurantiogriseus TaxID=66870 RepID=A0A918F4C4_9ACTN|nr:hypothetical protein GCM10010251_14330 [Streptomyces aurantiogriseus]
MRLSVPAGKGEAHDLLPVGGGLAPQEASPSDADEVERHPCPRCRAEPGSPCRSRSGAVAGTYHTGRFTKVPRLAKLLRVPAPADRGPGRPWRRAPRNPRQLKNLPTRRQALALRLTEC